MSEYRLKATLGLGFIFAHLALLGFLTFLRAKGAFDTPQFTTSLAIIIPLLGGHAVVMTKYLMDVEPSRERRSRPMPTVVLSLSLPFVYLGALAGLGMLKWIGTLEFDDFKVLLGTAELVFGAMVAHVISSLYGAAPQRATPALDAK